MSRSIDWRALCVSADPDFARRSTRVPEYEFTAPSRAQLKADPEADDDRYASVRTFYGNYKTRGAYAPVTSEDGALLWSGGPLTWSGIQITWDA